MPKPPKKISQKRPKKQPLTTAIRIIAGKWRRQQITVIDSDGLRPSGDKTREILFNWIAFNIEGARCLDLFAGTGALGIESLSRGAKFTTFIEQNTKVYHQLKNNISKLTNLDSNDYYCFQCNAESFLANSCSADKQPTQYDIIFIDPPFVENLWQETINSITNSQILAPNGLIYIESDKKVSLNPPNHWVLKKEKSLGNVAIRLYQQP